MSKLFDYLYVSECNPSYVVYRNVFNLSKCTLKEGALRHKQAFFMFKEDAIIYCIWRNKLLISLLSTTEGENPNGN